MKSLLLVPMPYGPISHLAMDGAQKKATHVAKSGSFSVAPKQNRNAQGPSKNRKTKREGKRKPYRADQAQQPSEPTHGVGVDALGQHPPPPNGPDNPRSGNSPTRPPPRGSRAFHIFRLLTRRSSHRPSISSLLHPLSRPPVAKKRSSPCRSPHVRRRPL
jgi:hypothetical protein